MSAPERFCIAMNLANRAFTQFDGFNFNSFARAGENYLAANEDGFFLLGGDTDDGAEIDATLTLKNTDFGDYRVKRFLRAHFGYEASGVLTLSLSPDEGAASQYILPHPAAAGLQHGLWKNLDGAQRGRYWQATVANVAGADFAVDDILPVTAGKGKKQLFTGSMGLSTKVDPTRIHYDPESGVQALASCSNVVIDDTGSISRRQGFLRLQAGQFHSLFCNQGDCLVIQEHPGSAALYRVNTDFSLSGIRSGLSKGRPMAHHSVNGQIYYSNGVQNGVYSEAKGTSSPWVKGETIGHRSDRETCNPPQASHIASIGINMILAEATHPSILWTSEPGTFSAYNLDDGHHDMAASGTLLKAVADGVWIGTSRNTMFLSGTVLSEWQVEVYPIV